jgi:hypothetical protein
MVTKEQENQVIELAKSIGKVDYDSYTQTSEYANFILPEIRRISGYKDSMNVGIYTDCNEENYYNYEDLFEIFLENLNIF